MHDKGETPLEVLDKILDLVGWPSVPDEPLAVLVFGHEVAPRTQTDDSHSTLRRDSYHAVGMPTAGPVATRPSRQRASGRPPGASPQSPPGACGPPHSRSAVRRRRGSGVAPELADPVGSLEVGHHQDVQQLGAGSRAERLQAFPEQRSTSSGRIMYLIQRERARRAGGGMPFVERAASRALDAAAPYSG